jgi:CubicO group peptidase (beta-lactamase class C family)
MHTVLRLAAVAAACACAQTTPRFADPQRRAGLQTGFAEADRAMERFHRSRGTPGLIYGIVIDGELAHLKSFGVQNVASKAPVTADTVFRIASMTKSFTALAVLKLRDEGKLSLDDLVSKWIPEFERMPMPTRDAAPLRVRHLLTHTAGFPEDNPWGDQQLGESDETLTAWLRAGIPFSTSPATAFEYSNYGFALAGRVISKAAGVPYREYLEKQILAPLGMSASTLEPSAVPEGVRATGYRKLPDGTYREERPLPHGSFGAMGGLLTSAPDLARYVAFHLGAWPSRDDDDRGPVKRSSVREMHMMSVQDGLSLASPTPSRPLAATVSGYGYGLRITSDCRFRHIVGHGGGLPGFGSYMTWLPEYGVGLFAMSNLTYAGPAAALNEVYDALRKTGALKPRELPPSPILTATRDAIFDLWRRWDDSKARRVAAGNLFLDIPVAQRVAEMKRIQARVGNCTAPTAVEPENLLRGRFRLNCERGTVHVTFTLAPTQPPAVQHLAFAETTPRGDNICQP